VSTAALDGGGGRQRGGCYIAQILVGEDDGDVAFQLISKAEQSLVVVVLGKLLDDEANHGVLANEHLGLATHGVTDLTARELRMERQRRGRTRCGEDGQGGGTWCIWLEVTLSSSTMNMREKLASSFSRVILKFCLRSS